MTLFFNRVIRVRLATNILYDTLMKNCFKDWSQSKQTVLSGHGLISAIASCPYNTVLAHLQFPRTAN